MVLRRATICLRDITNGWKVNGQRTSCNHFSTTSRSGAILPEPKRTRFGFLGVISAVVIGLLIGATISKNVAHFLEENQVFVPSDDDADDDED